MKVHFLTSTKSFSTCIGYIRIISLTISMSCGGIIDSMAQAYSLDWVRQISGVNNEEGRGIVLDALGNIYVTGVFSGTADFDPGVGVFNLTAPSTSVPDIFVAKYDPVGNFIWAAQIGGPQPQLANAIALDPLGNILITGSFKGVCDFDPGPGTFTIGPISTDDIFILKLDNDGNFVWVKHIASPVSEFGNSITADAVGNVFVTGEFGGPTDFDPGAGTTTLTPLGSFDIFVLKLDTDGNFIFAFPLGGTGQDRGNYISVDVFNNFYVTGFYRNTVDFDPGIGTTNLTASGTSSDVFIAKFDISTNLQWVRGIGFTQGDEGHSVTTNSSGEVTVTGIFRQTVDFDPGPGVFNLTAVSAGSIFDWVLDSSGDFVSATARIGDTVSDIGNYATTDASGNLYKTGDFSSTGDFDPGPGVVNLTATALDMFIIKLIPVGSSPTITSFTPLSGAINTTVTITGTNFSTTPANNTVQFNGTTAVVTASSPTSITTTVPVGATTGTITVTVGGNTATSASDFTILSVALPTITSFTPSSGPVGTTVTITGTNFSTTPANTTVQFNGTTALVTASTATSITATVPVGTTTGTITVTVGGNTATSSTDFTVTASPVITITTQPSPSAVCVGATTTFTTAASGTTNITYQWQFSATLAGTYSSIANGSGYSNVTTATLSVNTTGNFGAGFYRCQVNGDFAVTVFTDAVELIINVIPTPPITTSASKCGPGNITLSANGGTAGQYRWYDLATGGAALVGETNTTFTTPSLSATTTYYVAINNGSCESTRTAVTATINAIPLKPTINSTITPSGNNVSVCSSNTLTLTAPPSFNFYAWSNGETTQQIIITSSGTYSVTVDSGNGCSSPSSDDINVTVIPEPCANQPPVFIATQSTATLSGNISIDLASLISDTDNNLDLASLKIVSQPISGAIAEISNTILMIDYSGLSFTGLDKTTIEVCDLLASCTQQDITIEVVGNLIIYSGISPNGDPFNEKWIIQNIESLPDTKVNQVKIYNRWGDLVYETDNYDNDTRAFRGINKNGMEVSSGVYFYKIEFKSGRKMLSGYITVAQ